MTRCRTADATIAAGEYGIESAVGAGTGGVIAPGAEQQPAHALLYQIGPQSFVDRVLIAWSRSPAGAADASWRALADLPRRWMPPRFPQGGGFHPARRCCGPALGVALRAAEAAWIAADFPVDQGR